LGGLGDSAGEYPIGVCPIERAHIGVDVVSGARAKIDVIGVLVHIECDQRMTVRERHGVIKRPLIEEASGAW